MDQALQDLRITSSILQRKYDDLESEKKKLEKDMEEERRALTHHIDELSLCTRIFIFYEYGSRYFNDPILFLFNYNGLKRNVNIPHH